MSIFNKTYRNLTNKKIYLYRPLFLMLLTFIGVLSILFLKYGEFSLIIFLVSLSWTLVFFIFPLLILDFNYSKYNKNMVLNLSNTSICIRTKSKKIAFELDDIDYVEFNLSVTSYYKHMGIAFWNEYYYVLIQLRGGEKYIITCLLCDELEDFIPTKLIKKRMRIFPLVEIRTKQEIVIEKSELERKTQVFINKLKHKTLSELENIINNKNQYLPEAVEAAKKLLELKKMQQ